MSVTVQQSINRQALWLELQRVARTQFELEIDANPDAYGVAPSRSQRREQKRRDSGRSRPGRGKNRQGRG